MTWILTTLCRKLAWNCPFPSVFTFLQDRVSQAELLGTQFGVLCHCRGVGVLRGQQRNWEPISQAVAWDEKRSDETQIPTAFIISSSLKYSPCHLFDGFRILRQILFSHVRHSDGNSKYTWNVIRFCTIYFYVE